MNNTISNIVVYIKDEAMLEEAREMLEANECKVNENMFWLNKYPQLNYLYYHKYKHYFNVGPKITGETEITLTELEQLLKQNRYE